MKNWLVERLKENSTYRGLSLLFGAAGIAVAPEHIESIIATVFTIVGVINTVRKER